MAYKSGHIYLIDHEPIGAELATFAKPVQFDICDNGLYYSILYDKNGNKFVQNQNKVVTGFIKIGQIVQDENHISIGVHPSGFNHWRINGVDITTAQAAVLEVDPVADGEFRIDWIVGNSAGGLFILPGEAGKIPLKPNPLDYPSFAFLTEVLVTPDGLGGGIVTLNLADVFTGDGNAVALDIKEASTDHRGTMSSVHWNKLEGINLALYASLAGLDAEIVNRAAADLFLQNKINTEVADRIAANLLKLDKITAPNNTNERLINADGSTTSKGNYSRTLQIEVSTNTVALEDWKGKLILITASCTVTIPSVLSDSWGCEMATLPGASLNLALTTPKTWLFGTPAVVPEKSILTVAQRGATNSVAIFGI